VPAWTGDAEAGDDALSTSLSSATFDPDRGGLLTGLDFAGVGGLVVQAGTEGNGLYTDAWSLVLGAGPSSGEVLADGPVVAALRYTGDRTDEDGAAELDVVWFVIAGRPELWSAVTCTTTQDTLLAWPADAWLGVRPWQGSAPLLEDAVVTLDPASTWLDLSNGQHGVAWGYATAPARVVDLEADQGVFWSAANDGSAGSTSPVTVASGTAVVDGAIMVLMPHTGLWADAEDGFLGLLEGVAVTAGAAEAR
jgi:hypothetical protein